MTDFFREVDEELRNEKLRSFWRRYGLYIILSAVFVVVGTAAFRGYEYWQQSRAGQAGDEFLQAVALFDEGKSEEAQAALNEIVSNSHGGYPALAKFRLAADKAAGGDVKGAIGDFEALASDPSAPKSLQDFAQIRAAILAVDEEDTAALSSRLGAYLTAESPWRHAARELIALSYWKAGEKVKAAEQIAEMRADSETPLGVSQRVNILAEMIVSSGGTIPETEPAEGTSN